MAEKKNKIKKIIMIAGSVAGGIFVASKVIGKTKKTNAIPKGDSEQENPFEGKKVIFVPDENDKMNADGEKGHLEVVGEIDCHPGFYEKYVKRAFDIILSLGGLIVLSPVFLIVSLAIFIEDPGPVFFTQKRIGQNKKYFKLHKFRSMKMCTPHDVPTHMLDNSEQYITRVGHFIRLHSIDELPQVWDIFVGNMSVIGPRPGLWNQDVLTAERDKYGANNVKPGLTGWAQINGRDEVEIQDKAKLDGEYVSKESFLLDAKCFLGTVGKIIKDDSVVEGGTGEFQKMNIFNDNVESMTELTLGIVTYNSAEEISILMESLEKCNYFEKIKVYVVDNASSDDTVEIIKNKYSWVNLYESEENLGFGAAHNLIIKHVYSMYHIIVNPDIRVDIDTFEKSVGFMNDNQEIAVVTPFIKNTNGTQQFLPKKNPSMKYMIGGMFENYSKLCKKIREEYTMQNVKVTQPIDVEFCSGCFMITRTEALHKVEGFDDRYFLHFEDADLTRKLTKIGRAVYNPEIVVTHKWERDNKKINKSFWIALKSMFIYMRKWR